MRLYELEAALPAFLLGVGMSMIVHRSHPERAFVWHTNLEANSDEDIQANDAEGYVSASCRFGEKTRYIHLQTLKKVVLDLQFGEMKIFFDPTAIAEQGLVIHANVSFGELELTVPRTWEIDNHVSVFAGTVTEPQVISGEARTKVKLVGNVNFAEITIHYI
jgi:predicted membrane protein